MKSPLSSFGPNLQYILTEMCNRVGAEPEAVDFGQHEWFYAHSWTMKEDEAFIEWVADYLYTHAKARREIMSFPRKSKAYCKKTAQALSLFCSWRITKEQEDNG